MKRLSTCYVALARQAKHAAMLYHLMGDRDQEEHYEELVRGYMDSARRFKHNQPLELAS